MVMRHMKLASARFARSISLVTVIAGTAGLSPCAGSAHAQEIRTPEVVPALPEGMREPTNAALLYARAMRLISPESLGAMGERDPKTDEPTDRAREAIESFGGSLSVARRASRLESCDWGIEYQQGPGALMDHLGPFRGLWRALDNETALMAKSEPDRAVENLIAMLSMCEHITQDRILISSLVGTAMTSGTVRRLNLMMDAGVVTREHTPDLLVGLERVRGLDLFRLREAMANEKWTASQWLRAVGTGPDAGSRVAELLGTLVADDSDAILDALALMDERQLSPLFDETARAYNDMIAALDSADPASELERISIAIDKGDYGVVTMRFAANLTRAYASAARVTGELNGAIERISAMR